MVYNFSCLAVTARKLGDSDSHGKKVEMIGRWITPAD
jgi:hypothetical protein